MDDCDGGGSNGNVDGSDGGGRSTAAAMSIFEGCSAQSTGSISRSKIMRNVGVDLKWEMSELI